MAQSVEHVIGNDEVISSILITSSKTRTQKRSGFLLNNIKKQLTKRKKCDKMYCNIKTL